MSESFQVEFSDPAKEDLDRLFEFLLTRAMTSEDLDQAQEVIGELRQAIEVQLARAPFNYRKAGSSFRRELVVPVGKSGYVVLYDIRPPSQVLVLAIRHQLEDDYHWARLGRVSPAAWRCREQPETGIGAIVISLEYETGVVQVIWWKSLRDALRKELLQSRLLPVHGARRAGIEVMHDPQRPCQ